MKERAAPTFANSAFGIASARRWGAQPITSGSSTVTTPGARQRTKQSASPRHQSRVEITSPLVVLACRWCPVPLRLHSPQARRISHHPKTTGLRLRQSRRTVVPEGTARGERLHMAAQQDHLQGKAGRVAPRLRLTILHFHWVTTATQAAGWSTCRAGSIDWLRLWILHGWPTVTPLRRSTVLPADSTRNRKSAWRFSPCYAHDKWRGGDLNVLRAFNLSAVPLVTVFFPARHSRSRCFVWLKPAHFFLCPSVRCSK
jgi:hypothetical protein